MGGMKMKLIRILIRGIRDAFKSVFRNISLSLASISAISITLSIVALSLVASKNINSFTKNIRDDVTMVVLVKMNTQKQDISGIERGINKLDNIEFVAFKSKFQQKEEMMKKSDAFRIALESFSDDELPLQDSFMVKVKELENIEKTEKEIKAINGVDKVNYGKNMVNKLLSATKLIEKVMYIVVGILIIVTVFLIINTIKLTIYSRKREIEIKRLVGVSNISIKYPFVIEGIILGLIGSILPGVLIIIGYPKLYNQFGGVMFARMFKLIEPSQFVFDISLYILALGILVGMIGSLSAVRRYLKV